VMIAEIAIQIKAVHEIKKVLRDDWRICHPPNEEVQAARSLSKQQALGMLAGIPDLIAFSPEGKSHFMEFKTETGTLNEAQEDFQLWCLKHDLPHSVVRSVDEAMKVFHHWGAIKNLEN
jgi:VRR-NUC domain